MSDPQCLIANPLIILREEFDDWAVLFDPDTSKSFGLNPVSVFIYKLLDGKHSVADIVKELRSVCPAAPEDADRFVGAFLNDLVAKGIAGHISNAE